jgi:GxxExxY protein
MHGGSSRRNEHDEDHEAVTTLRIASTLSSDLEDLVRRTIGALLDVHRELGSGMNESIYTAATQVELASRGIPFKSERLFHVRYRGHLLGHSRIDLFVGGRLIVEVNSVERLHPAHVAQVVSYLRVTGARLALLVNFNVPILKQGIRRTVL